MEFHVGRLRRIHERAVTHARIRITNIVGGAIAMSFGEKNSPAGHCLASVEKWALTPSWLDAPTQRTVRVVGGGCVCACARLCAWECARGCVRACVRTCMRAVFAIIR